MGFFDLFASKKNQPVKSSPESVPAPSPAPVGTPVPIQQPLSSGTTASLPLKERLLAARGKLESKDLATALAIYDQVLAESGDRADVLVAISADLGANGYVDTIVEILAPRYDATRHGPAAGINLLQAYLITRQPEPAQHLLDILFALKRPELEQRLHGFSNALAELIEAQARGEQLPKEAPVPANEAAQSMSVAPKSVSLASISKPIWAYGIEAVPSLLPPGKEGKLRRVAFGQLAVIEAGNKQLDLPESVWTRFSRGLPLWFAETFYFSPHYAPIAVIGLLGKDKLASFPSDWTTDNIRQLVQTSSDGVDYVFTGSLQLAGDRRVLTLRVWEVKKLKERKQFSIEFSGDNADDALRSLHEQVRLFMEWQSHPAVPAYTPPASPLAWCDSLACSVELFLSDKAVIPPIDGEKAAEIGAKLAVRSNSSERDALCWYTGVDRARRIGVVGQFPAAASPHTGTTAEAGRALLGL